MLQRKLLSESGNPSKAFMCLELGLIPVKFVIMSRRAQFLKYILEEPTDSMKREVFEVLKADSRKGDFVDLVEKDLRELKINMSQDEIQQCSKGKWKHLIKKHVKEAAFSHLVKENNTKDKTKVIQFKMLQMSDYLRVNKIIRE